jgi:unsaturated rhamnogalacturonyl hydrolase
LPGRTRGERRLASRDVLHRLAERTRRFDFGVWFWGDAIAFDGLVDAADLVGDAPSASFCRGFFESWQARPRSWIDYLTPGLALLRLVRAGAKEFRPTVVRLVDHYLVHTPKGDTGLHYFRPDLPQFRTTVLVDSLYHVPPFLAAAAGLLNEPTLGDEAIAMWRSHRDALSDERPLLFHNYDRGAGRRRGYGWGRGNGWALFGLLDLLELLPKQEAVSARLPDEFRALSAAVLPLQDESGFWRTLLDDREAYLETSTAAFYGAVFTKGVRLGLLPETYAQSASRAWHALVSRIDDEGGAFGTSAATWAANAPAEDLALYKSAPTEVNVWGQGAALRFAAERIRAGLE